MKTIRTSFNTMQSGRFLTSTIHFSSGIFFILFGILTLMVPWAPRYRDALIYLLTQGWLLLLPIGCAFIALGILLLKYITVRNRTYYQIRSGDRAVSVSETLIESALNIYWTEQFPNREVFCNIQIRNSVLHITVDLPYVLFTEQKARLHQIENELTELFKTLGYTDSFHLLASFLPKEVEKEHLLAAPSPQSIKADGPTIS